MVVYWNHHIWPQVCPLTCTSITDTVNVTSRPLDPVLDVRVSSPCEDGDWHMLFLQHLSQELLTSPSHRTSWQPKTVCPLLRFDDDYYCFYHYKRLFSTLDWGCLCAQICYFRFKFIGSFALTFFAFLFRKKQYVKEEGSNCSRPISYPASYHMHAHVYFVHIYEYVYAEM